MRVYASDFYKKRGATDKHRTSLALEINKELRQSDEAQRSAQLSTKQPA
jgi:hypothetical protein